MKVNLEDLRLGVSELTDEVFVGIMEKNGMLWKHKINLTNDFIQAVVQRWQNQKQTFTRNGYEYEVSVKKTKIKPKPKNHDLHLSQPRS